MTVLRLHDDAMRDIREAARKAMEFMPPVVASLDQILDD